MRKKKTQNIHFVGIKGVGMTPLAIIAKEAGFTVTGSDIDEEFITDSALKKAKITSLIGFSTEHIITPDLVITTGAHGGFDNVEVITAKERGIPVITAAEAIGRYMDGFLGKSFKGISVTGAHGKTTTSAMIATLLRESGLDPSYLIGTGNVLSLGAPGHFGKGMYFISEADEYAAEPIHDRRAKFLFQHPSIAVITNIEYDHPDMYSSLDSLRNTYRKFLDNILNGGVLITCGDDPEVKKMLIEYGGNVLTYGFNSDNHYRIKRINVSGSQTFFWVEANGSLLGNFVTGVAGEHNALNALATLIVGIQIGIPLEKIKKGLHAFKGSKRRLEFIGELRSGTLVYDDYAHHPTEIIKTLQTLRKQYPKKRLVCLYQPHTFSRTKTFFKEFTKSFVSADRVVLTDIYASLREVKDESVSSQKLAEAMKGIHPDVIFQPDLQDVLEYIGKQRFHSDTILVTMGAGDIYKIHEKLPFI